MVNLTISVEKVITHHATCPYGECPETPCRPCAVPPGSRTVIIAICGLLCLAVVLVFCQTGGYDFVNFDDDRLRLRQRASQSRIHLGGPALLFLPLARLYLPSADDLFAHARLPVVRTGGRRPPRMNIVLHAITAVLLFLLLRRMTGRLWPSALVAALFAIHPLRVESVAWISERKDVLSGLFFVLTLGAYVRYVRACRQAGQLPASSRWRRHLPAACGASRCWRPLPIVCSCLGLLAKPMLVTLPLVLLLLDYWPLRRWQASWRLLIEKIPLLLLSLADSALTVHTQVACHPVAGSISWLARGANALVAYASYVGCFFWPQGLAILYPHPIDGFSVGTGSGSGRGPGGGIGRRVPLQTAGAVLARRLAVVLGNARPGDRSAPGRRAVDGRSLHLPAADRPGAGAGLGRGGKRDKLKTEKLKGRAAG